MAEEAKKKKRPTAEKRCIQDENKRLRNKIFKSKYRTTVRAFEEKCKAGDSAAVQETLAEVFSSLDKGAKRGVFKKGKVNRLKSKFYAKAAQV